MRTMTATEASRGFSDLLDAVERGETIRITRGGKPVAEFRPTPGKTGRDLSRALDASPHHLTDEDADEMLRVIEETHSLLRPYESPWDRYDD